MLNISQPYKLIGAQAEVTTAGASAIAGPAIPAKANAVILQAITDDCYYTLDGSVPTITHGFFLSHAAAPVMVPVNRLSVLKFIRAGSTNMKVSYQFVDVKGRL